jgi:hypothetical protein
MTNDIPSLLARLERLTPDSQRLWGSMSVGQMMTHCTDQVQIVLGEKPARQRGTAFSRWFSKWVAMNVPMKLPKNMKTIAELDPNRPLMTQPTEFVRDRASLAGTLQRLDNVPEAHQFAHPVFGTLSKTEAIKLTHIHLDHHLRQFGV